MRERSSGETIGLRPGGRVCGAVNVPGSKSIAQRALILASLASGTTRLTHLPDAEDVAAALQLVADAGAGVARLAPAAVAVTGRPPGPGRGWRGGGVLLAGESGTLARLATAAAAWCASPGHAVQIQVRGSLAGRRSTALIDSLRGAGVRIEATESAQGSGWPLRVEPLGPPNGVRLVAPRSSQEVSALLIALAAWPDAFVLDVEGEIPSRPYVELTLFELERFGARVTRVVRAGGESFEVQGPLRAPESPIAIEPDASAAAVALAAACLSGGDARVQGLTARSRQGDVRIVEHLRAFGCDAGADEQGLFARGAVTRACELDLVGEPDLAPVVAVLAARAALSGCGTSRLAGLGTLPGKESSRIEVLAAGLRAIGLVAEASREELVIRPGAQAASVEVELDPHGDHRMAFAFGLLGLIAPSVQVLEPGCVAKSWPRFWSDLSHAGARIVHRNST